MKNVITRFISSTLICSMLSMSIWIQSAQAILITTEQVIVSQTSQQAREQVRTFLGRADVQTQLESRGVNAEDAKARVDAMTDNEIASINGHLDSLPAGGSAEILVGLYVVALALLFIWMIKDLSRMILE